MSSKRGHRHSPIFALSVVIFVCGLPGGFSLRFSPKVSESNKDGEVNIKEGGTLVLTCEGDEPVTWVPLKNAEKRYKEEVSTSDSSSLRNYKSVLKLVDIVSSDSGIFVCYHKNAVDPDNALDKTEVSVFVSKDDEHLLKPTPQLQPIQIRSSSISVIPCVPTSSSVNVTLWKTDVTPHKQFAADGLTVTFEPFKGFLINFPSPVFSGNFYCLATKESRSEKLHVILLYFSDTTAVPTPNIETKEKFAVENSDFVLTCSVRGTLDVIFFLNWTYPSLIESRRIVLGDNVSKDVTHINGIKYRETSRNITVKDIRRSDQGDFTCIVTDHTSRSNQKSTFVEVRDKGNAFISFSLGDGGGEDEAIVQPLGSPFAKFVVFVKYFPTQPSIMWYKGRRLLGSNNKHRITNTDKTSTLVVSDLGRNDTGEYTIVGRMGDIEEHFTLTLLVTEPPEVRIKEAKLMFERGKNFKIVCHVEGCPQSNVSWEWSPCQTAESCPKNFKLMTGTGTNFEQVTESGDFEVDGCLVKSILSGTAQTAGYYRCAAESALGLNSSETSFFITEFPSAFGRYLSTTVPFEGDEVLLTCNASAFYYSHLLWEWIPEEQTASIPIANNTDTTVILGATNYSFTTRVHLFRVKPNNGGLYMCRAKQRSNNQWAFLSDVISVKKTFPPRIIQTNLNGSQYDLYKEDNFEFICLVEGVPKPNISWYRNDTKIFAFEDDGAVQILDDSSKLYISRVLPSDTGRYACQATNRAGMLFLNATLVVRYATRISGLSKGTIVGLILVSLIGVTAIVVLGIIVGRRYHREKKEKKELRLIQHMLFDKGDLGSYNPDLPLEDQIDSLPYDKSWEFPRHQLKLGRTIGQGAFGRVVKGEAFRLLETEESTAVAVKMLKERADLEQQKALMQELKIMIHLGRHINVVNLLGAVTKELHKGEFLVIVEYCRFGNLRHFLLRSRDNFVNQLDPVTGQVNSSIVCASTINGFCKHPAQFSDSVHTGTTSIESGGFSTSGSVSTPTVDSVGNMDSTSAKSSSSWTISTTDLISYAFQVSCGMEYLSFKKLVHRDLALRNVLLAEGNILKICDFGLAKDCYKKSYYRKKGQGPLPVKWMAIESIRDKIFSVESDVWSFGIILWELFTLGGNPYPGLEVGEEFYRKLANGYRMEKPDCAPEAIYTMMLDCWLHDPKWRPTFSSLKERLSNMLDNKLVQHYLNMNKTFASAVENPYYLSMLPGGEECDKSQHDYENAVVSDPQAQTVHYLHMTNPGDNRMSVYGEKAHPVVGDELRPMLFRTDGVHYKELPKTVRPVNNLSSPNNPFLQSNTDEDVKGYLDMGSKVPDSIPNADSGNVFFQGDPNYQVPLSPPPRISDVPHETFNI